jgi:hypothetical protein
MSQEVVFRKRPQRAASRRVRGDDADESTVGIAAAALGEAPARGKGKKGGLSFDELEGGGEGEEGEGEAILAPKKLAPREGQRVALVSSAESPATRAF